MKLKVVALALLVVGFAISFSTVMPLEAGPNSPAATATRPAAAPASPAAVPQEHPEIREAIDALRRAKDHLQHAKHDYSGHREAAIRATDEAIRQLEICLKYD